MPSFGEKLKQEREKRKISLEQISISTKIGTRMLQALEEDRFNQLPGGIFNKGFVRAYSHCLGLDEDQTVAEYLAASGDAPPPRTEVASRENGVRENEEHIRRLESIAESPPRRLPWGLLAAILLLITLALALWTRHQRERALQTVVPVPATATLPPAQMSGEMSAKNSDAANLNAPPEVRGALSSPAESVASSAATPASSARDSSAAATSGEFTIVIMAHEQSWLSITADGKSAPPELLSAGSERTVHGEKEVVIRAGNSGGVDFRFNGRKLDSDAKYGEIRTVTFGPGGIVSSVPPATSTP